MRQGGVRRKSPRSGTDSGLAKVFPGQVGPGASRESGVVKRVLEEGLEFFPICLSV